MKPGEVVVLKSGGPPMTVTSVTPVASSIAVKAFADDFGLFAKHAAWELWARQLTPRQAGICKSLEYFAKRPDRSGDMAIVGAGPEDSFIWEALFTPWMGLRGLGRTLLAGDQFDGAPFTEGVTASRWYRDVAGALGVDVEAWCSRVVPLSFNGFAGHGGDTVILVDSLGWEQGEFANEVPLIRSRLNDRKRGLLLIDTKGKWPKGMAPNSYTFDVQIEEAENRPLPPPATPTGHITVTCQWFDDQLRCHRDRFHSNALRGSSL